MWVEEAERVNGYLIKIVEGIKVCPYCGEAIYDGSKWVNRHAPIIRIYDDKIEAGYLCASKVETKEDDDSECASGEVILFTVDKGSGCAAQVKPAG